MIYSETVNKSDEGVIYLWLSMRVTDKIQSSDRLGDQASKIGAKEKNCGGEFERQGLLRSRGAHDEVALRTKAGCEPLSSGWSNSLGGNDEILGDE